MENLPSAQESLALADRSRRAAVERSQSPWWYFPAIGVVVGLTMVAFLLFPKGPIGLISLVMTVSLIFIDRARRRVTGTRVSEFRRGRASIYAVVGALLVNGIVVGAWFLVVDRHNTWVAWVVGAAIFGVIGISGWLFERASRTAVTSGRR